MLGSALFRRVSFVYCWTFDWDGYLFNSVCCFTDKFRCNRFNRSCNICRKMNSIKIWAPPSRNRLLCSYCWSSLLSQWWCPCSNPLNSHQGTGKHKYQKLWILSIIPIKLFPKFGEKCLAETEVYLFYPLNSHQGRVLMSVITEFNYYTFYALIKVWKKWFIETVNSIYCIF